MKIATVLKDGERAVVDLLGPRIEPLASSEDESYCVMKGILGPVGRAVLRRMPRWELS
jgi:hypothetical protein